MKQLLIFLFVPVLLISCRSESADKIYYTYPTGSGNYKEGTRVAYLQGSVVYYGTENDNKDYKALFGANIVSNNYSNGKGVITFDDDVSLIGSGAFYYNSDLTSVTIPTKVTSIGSHAFEYCGSITEISIPDGVKEIGYGAFINCYSLERVNIGNLESWCNIDFRGSGANPLSDGGNLYLKGRLLTEFKTPRTIKQLKHNVFYGAKCLKSVEITENVTSIGNNAFYDCISLSRVVIPESLKEIKDYAFYSCISLKEITIPQSVSVIGKYAFDNCQSLVEVFIPGGITRIENSSFNNCPSLSNVDIAEGVKEIGSNAFSSCKKLTRIILPESINRIEEMAFAGCNLCEIFCKATTPPSLGNYAFGDFQIIYVPVGSGNTYRSAWRGKVNPKQITEYNFDTL